MLRKKFLVSLVLLFSFFCVSSIFVTEVRADVGCFISKVVFGGTDHPQTTNIPPGTDFSIKVTCTSLPGPKDVTITFNGISRTVNGLSGLLDTTFGTWNFPTAVSGAVTISIPGETVTCSSPGACQVNMSGSPVPTPPPEAVETNCPSGYDYEPTDPIKGSDFNVIFNLPDTPFVKSQYTFQYIRSGGDIGNYSIIDEDGIWVVHFPAVDGQTSWSLNQTVDGHTATCWGATLFRSGTGAGSNPCVGGVCETALGDLPIGLKNLADRVLQIGIGLAGGIALILIVFGSIRVLISGGDQQKLNGGREMIIAAVAGLLFLLLSTVILEFIGLNILGRVPGISS